MNTCVKQFLIPILFISIGSAVFDQGLAKAAPETKALKLAERKDFAFARAFSAATESSVLEAEIPEDVYERTLRADLGDIRVFNATGEMLPQWISRASQATIQESTLSHPSIPYFQINKAAEAGSASRGTAVQLKEDAAGRVLSVQFAAPQETGGAGESWFLLDTRTVTDPLQALSFRCSDLPADQLIQVDLESSEDLEHWSAMNARGVLARLRFLDQEFERNKIEFLPQRHQFLRVRFRTSGALTLLGVEGDAVKVSARLPEERRKTFSGGREDERENAVTFDTHMHLPSHAVQIELAAVNSAYRVRLESRAQEESPWVQRFSGSVYRLGAAGGEVTNPDISTNGITTDRYWRVSVEGKDVSLGRDLPRLVLVWRPSKIAFLARPPGPFEMLYGSALVGAPDFGVGQGDEILRKGVNQQSMAGPATLGEPIVVGGEAKLTPSPAQIEVSGKQLALWAALCAFVVVVGAMALRLWKDLQKEGGREK